MVPANMKNLIRNLLFSTLLIVASVAYGAGVAPMDVTVSGPGGKVAYKGKTDASGTFSTPKLAPGNYIVQFNSPGLKAGQYAVVVSAGKKKVTADAIIGDKFAKGGVAMRVDVGAGLNITGQVALAGGAVRPGMVWIPPMLGSNRPGHWAEEGSAEAVESKNRSNVGRGQIQGIQDKGVGMGGG
jgi:hypothetical protein